VRNHSHSIIGLTRHQPIATMNTSSKRTQAPSERTPALCRQAGRSLTSVLALVVLAAAAGLGGWWWKTHAGADQGAAGASAAASAAAGQGGTGGTGAAGRRGGGPSRNQPVSVQVARKQDLRVIVNAIGNVVALNTAVVHTRVDGLITVVSIREGQPVQAGQVLMQLDPSTFKAAYDSAAGMLARDQAQLDASKVDLARYKALLAKDSIQSQQVDTQDALVRQLTGTVKADQAAVDTAKLNLDWTTVRAPITGRMGLRAYDLGNMVHAADPGGIVTITQTQPIGATFTIPELNLSQVLRQVKAGAAMPVEAWDREQKRQLALGTLLATDNAVDPTTGTIRMKARFANKDDSLFPNQFVNLRMQVDTIKDATAVPANAIQRGSMGTFVYVVDTASSAVSVRRVRMGVADGDWVGVTGEVNPGDTVVTDGADRLRDGAKVDVIVPQAAAPGAGGGAGRKRGAASAASAPGGPANGTPGAPAAPAPTFTAPPGANPPAGAGNASAAATAPATTAGGDRHAGWISCHPTPPPPRLKKLRAWTPTRGATTSGNCANSKPNSAGFRP